MDWQYVSINNTILQVKLFGKHVTIWSKWLNWRDYEDWQGWYNVTTNYVALNSKQDKELVKILDEKKKQDEKSKRPKHIRHNGKKYILMTKQK